MRFVCEELNGDVLDLKRKFDVEQISIVESNGITLTRDSKAWFRDSGTQWLYSADVVKSFRNELAVAQYALTMSAYVALFRLGLTTNLSAIASTPFDWQARSISGVKSSFWYTVLTETGVQFLAPVRLITSKEITGEIYSRAVQQKATSNFYGESSGDYQIGTAGDNVSPAAIGSDLKTLAVNKERSKTEIVEILSSADANPLDWYNDDGRIFVILSRREESENRYIYTAVLETQGIYTFSGSDIVVSDPWHYVGATGEPAFQNSWANYGYEYSPACFRKIDGWVILQGMIKSGSIGANAFTLPAGYRPASKLLFVTAGSDGVAGGAASYRKDIASNGGVLIFHGSNQWQSLNGITYFVGR